MRITKIAFLILTVIATHTAQAAWVDSGGYFSNYDVKMDNGVTYFYHPAIAAPCLYGRLEIRPDAPYSADYAKKLTALLFAANISGKRVSYVYDNATAPSCVLNSLGVEK
jgi:hypothetical protein